MRTFLLFGCVLTFVEFLTFISSVRINVNFKKYKHELSLAGFRCDLQKTAFETDNVSDATQCLKLCHFNKDCRSVFYIQESNKCIGCSINPDIPTVYMQTYNGSQYVRSEPVYAPESDCKDILKNTPTAPSGIYKISLWMTKKVLTVVCDMETDGGGWTVIQNRFDGNTDFNRNFDDYENGFGAAHGEFWLGLKHIQEIADHGSTDIRLEVATTFNESFFETYTDFKLSNGSEYRLSINVDSGMTGGKRFAFTNGSPFSTSDKCRDSLSAVNCAEYEGGGWWYREMHSIWTYVNLNGAPPIFHLDTVGASRMLIRR